MSTQAELEERHALIVQSLQGLKTRVESLRSSLVHLGGIANETDAAIRKALMVVTPKEVLETAERIKNVRGGPSPTTS